LPSDFLSATTPLAMACGRSTASGTAGLGGVESDKPHVRFVMNTDRIAVDYANICGINWGGNG
jgi:hypothetical protein